MAISDAPQPTKPIIVENVATFRRRQELNEICILPEVSQKRKNTDVAFLISFGICIVILLSLMIYALCNSNMQRFIHGYDTCGNVCGSKNTATDGIECSGQDMTDKPFLKYEYDMPSQCVEKCDIGYTSKFHRCFIGYYESDLGFLPYTVGIIQNESTGLIAMCFSGLGLSILSLILFRYFVREFVWTMVIGSLLLMFALTGYVWYLYSNSTLADDRSSFLYIGIILTIVSIIFALFILVLTTRIKLVIFLYNEAVKIVFAMPLILLEPALTFISNFLVVALFVYIFLLMATSGTLQEDVNNPERYTYVPNAAMSLVLWWSVIMLLWMAQFVLACQQMVISGAVAAYYFARDKLTIVSPIYNSFYNLVRYHLGTVAFGSLIITLITITKIIIRAMSRDNVWCRLFYICCFRPLEDFLKYMTSMGYIETAIHGQPLCASSIRAINLIITNLLSAVAMNSIGNLVFFMAKFAVVALVVIIGLLMKLSALTIVFGGVVAFICIHCVFVVFETAVDTIFLCYCEDHCVNDGNVNPYYTTLELQNQIQKAQAFTLALEKAKQNKKSKNK